jgi:hypothetical protein
MLYREIIVVCSEIHTKHINTLCGQNGELLNVKHSGTESNHWALEGSELMISKCTAKLSCKISAFLHTQYWRFAFDSHRTKQSISVYSTERLVFIMEANSVLHKVRNASIYRTL